MAKTGTNTTDSAKTAAEKPAGILDVQYLRTMLISIFAIVLLDVLGLDDLSLPIRYYLPLHIALELSSIVVCFAVFAMGWYGYRQTLNKRDLLITVTFATTGLLDFTHVLSYRGMPDFLAANTPGGAAAYWLTARLTVGVGLLVATFVNPHSKSRFLSPRCIPWLAAIFFALICILFTIYAPTVSSALWAAGPHPLTPLKIGLEYLVVFAYIAVFLVISERRGWDPTVVRTLRGALLLAMFAELSLTFYTSPFSMMNALGHVFKTAAYCMILSALFVSTLKRPYEQLSRARDELHELYTDAQEHRREIERSFSNIGSALSSSLKLGEALDQIALLAADMLHADLAIVASLGKHLELTQVATRGSGCHEADRPLDLAGVVGKRAVEERRSIIENDLSATDMVHCDFSRPDCLRSMICAPTVYENDVLGLISIYSHATNAFVEGDAKLLEGFALHAAVAIHNAMSYERESHIADVLQRSFLDSSKIKTDRFEIAQVYHPAMSEALVGGDFYDVIPLAEDKVALVIGDVSGKGLAAAVHTAMAKYTLRAYLGEGHPPAEAMRLLDRALTGFHNAETFITMFLGLLDINTGEALYVNAGHEPAIYSRDGVFLTLPATGPALGLGIDEDFTTGRVVIEKGGVLLMYTDGISEARQGKLFLGVERIGEILTRCEMVSSEDVAKCIYESALAFTGGELRDDAAILAVKAL